MIEMKQAGDPAYYLHSNGDKDFILVIRKEENSSLYWARWEDGFVTLITSDKVEFINKKGIICDD